MRLKTSFITINTIIIALLIVLGVLSFAMLQNQFQFDNHRIVRYQSNIIADELRQSSDDLTRYCRTYVLTGDSIWEKKYWEVLEIRDGKRARPDGRVIALQDSMKKLGFSPEELEKLKESENNSNNLVWTERAAFNAIKGLFDDGFGNFTIKSAPDPEKARSIMFDEKYHADKAKIMKPIDEFFALLDYRTNIEVKKHRNRSFWLLGLIIGLITMISIMSIISFFYIRNKIINQLNELKIAKEEIEASEIKLKIHNIELDSIVEERTKELLIQNAEYESLNEEYKTQNERLAESERYLRTLIEKSPLPMVITDENQDIELFSEKFSEMFGYTISDVSTAKQWWDSAYPDIKYRMIVQNSWEKAINIALKNGADIEMQVWDLTTKSGAKRTCEFHMVPIGKKNLIITNDITEIKKSEKELILAKNQAEESEKLKSAFFANMSHEIRTPMNGILGFAELLKEPGLTGKEQTDYIQVIEKSGERMLSTINDLVEMSRLESGNISVNYSKVDVNEQLEYIYDLFKAEAEKKGLKISYDSILPELDRTINTDREKLYGILTNLVKNAVKYSDKGNIHFGCQKKDDNFIFFVKDTGIGIPEDKQKSIFNRFIQVEMTKSRTYEGAGLGLSITKAYVKLLGGKLWVESELGEGSIFYFTIPT